jgi:hypothetical protein
VRPFVMRPGGFVLLLAVLRWKRPEGRWLLAMAIIPSTGNIYDALPLLVLAPWTFRELLILGILSHVADLAGYIVRANETYAALVAAHGVTVLWLFYVPAMVMILRRPNELGVHRARARGADHHRQDRPRVARGAEVPAGITADGRGASAVR